MKKITKYIKSYLKKRRLKSHGLDVSVHLDSRASISNVKAGSFSRFAAHSDVRDSCIGNYSTIGRYSKVAHSELGKFCSISWDCTVNAISHPYQNLTIHAFPYVPHAGQFVQTRKQSYKKVIIGNDVWIGANAVIMPGVKIGDGAIVGASAVVTKDVPPYAIVHGVPAKVHKYRFDEQTISDLLQIKWWDLDKDLLKKSIELFQGKFTAEKLKELKSLCR